MTLNLHRAPATARAPAKRTHSSGLGGLHDLMVILVPLFVGLAAVPLASNRPVLWLFNAALICMAGAAYFAVGALRRRQRPLHLTGHRSILVLLALVPLWSVMQAMPVIATALPDWVGAIQLRTVSVSPAASVLAALRFGSYLVLFVLVFETAARGDRARRMAWALFIVVLIHAMLGLVFLNLLGDLALFGEKQFYLRAATGTFVNRNSLATFLGFGIILGVALMLEPAIGRRPARIQLNAVFLRLLKWSCIGIMLLAQVATQSRLGSGATLVAVLVTALCMHRFARKADLKLVLGAAGLGLTLVIGLAGAGLLDRLVFAGSEAASRIEIYRQVLPMISERPVLGFGADTFALAFEMFRQPGLLPGQTLNLAHNSFLTLWCELGLLVGSAPLVAFALIGWRAWRALPAQESGRPILAAGIGSLVLAALHSLGDFSLEIPANAYLFTTLAALALARSATAGR